MVFHCLLGVFGVWCLVLFSINFIFTFLSLEF